MTHSDGIGYTKGEILQMIANTLVVYGYQIENNGLINGKMGAILFLYRYAAKIKSDYYEKYAGEMLDGVMNVALSLSSDFENGLPGVGWAISRLITGHFVDGDPNNVLRPIDERVLGRMACDRQAILGQAVYIAERMKQITSGNDLLRYANGMLDFIHRDLSRTNDCPSLGHINSCLYFMSFVKDMPETAEKCKDILQAIPLLYGNTNKGSHATAADLQMHKHLLTQMKADIDIPLKINGSEIISDDTETDSFLQNAWREQLYLGRLRSTPPPLHCLSAFVDNKQNSLQETDFCVKQGLSGLGLALMAATAG